MRKFIYGEVESWSNTVGDQFLLYIMCITKATSGSAVQLMLRCEWRIAIWILCFCSTTRDHGIFRSSVLERYDR